MEDNIRIINKTSHDINIVGETGNGIIIIKTFPKAKHPWKLNISAEFNGELSNQLGLGVYTNRVETIDLPTEKDNTYYIVSRKVAEHYTYRNDLLIKNGAIFDSKGIIVGFIGLAQIK